MRIYVIDIETTGLDGGPKDHVVEVGIAMVDTVAMTVKGKYSSIVGHDVDAWDGEARDAWVFKNTDLTLERVQKAHPINRPGNVALDIDHMIRDGAVTSYNTDFDFRRFLSRDPWILTLNVWPCVMQATMRHLGSKKRVSLEKAYNELCPDDPAGLGGRTMHRAMSDAVMAGHVLLGLIGRGAYCMGASL